jgi:tetratricopeptide (TPR) repeat protein
LHHLADQVELEVGRIYLNLGIARTAMDISGALKIVKERMAVDGETPELLCILGDVVSKNEDKIAAYQKAWDVSNGRSARAKRQLGIMAMNEGKFKEAIVHLKQALAINPQYVFFPLLILILIRLRG